MVDIWSILFFNFQTFNCLQISLSSPFWIVNKCGLPLIFKQDEADEEAAGQFFEHEAGKSMVPMIFSFTDSGTRRR